MLNPRPFILSIVLVVILMITAGLVTLGTNIVFDPSNDPAGLLESQVPSASQINLDYYSRPYKSPLDECYDVALRDRAECLSESQELTP
jgi:hypothetical protein